MKVKSLSHVQLFSTPWTAAYQDPPSMGFSRQEYWSGVPLSFPRLQFIGSQRVRHNWSNLEPAHMPTYGYQHKQGCTTHCSFTSFDLECAKKILLIIQFSSVQSLSRVWLFAPHGLQYARPPCSSPTLGAYSNSCPLSQWCHPTISSSIIPFSSHLQSFPALGSFPMSQFFTSGGQSIGASASASVLPMNIQDWFPLG